MKNHEPAAAWVAWSLQVFRMTPAQAGAVPLPDAKFGSEPPHFLVGQHDNTRNIEGMACAARAMFFFLLGTPQQFLEAKQELLALYAAEVLAHWGIETRAPAPHSFFYYMWMVVARQVAVMTGDAELLATTRDHWSAELALLRFCWTAQGGVWCPCERAVGDPNHDEATWVLLFLDGHQPGTQQLQNAKTPEQRGLEQLGTGWTVPAPLPRLATPLRRQDWPDGSVTIEFDTSQFPSFVETPVVWTRITAGGEKTFGRQGSVAPAGPGAPMAVAVAGGEWQGQPVTAGPVPPVQGSPMITELASLAASVKSLVLAKSEHHEQAAVIAALTGPPIPSPAALEELANVVAGFGIGNAQPQKKVQDAIVTRLRLLGGVH